MKVLVATKITQGRRGNDFCFVPEGEIVKFGFECDGEKVDGSCGCKRSMVGVESLTATTTMKVVKMPDMTKGKMLDIFIKSHASGGWTVNAESEKVLLNEINSLISVAEAFPVGTVVEKRGDSMETRPLTANDLYEICDRVHATCTNECPVFAKRGGLVNGECDCFKDGKKMLEFLKNKNGK